MKTIRNISIALLALSIFSACRKNELVIDNPPEFPWQSVNEFEQLIATPYDGAFYSGWGGAFFMSGNVISEAMSDVIYMIPRTSENWPQVPVYYRNVKTRITTTGDCFNGAYKAINHCNHGLDFAVDNRSRYYVANGKHAFDNLSVTEQSNLDRQIGELYFMRAYSYYSISLLFCPPGTSAFSQAVLPYRKEWTFEIEKLRYPEYANGKKIYDSVIIPDLIKAISYLPLNTGGQHPQYAYGRSRATRYAAATILARVYFSLGAEDASYYQKALDILNGTSAISGISAMGPIQSWPFSIETEPVKAFNRIGAETSTEVIWDAVYDSKLTGGPKDATLLTWNKYAASLTDTLVNHKKSKNELTANRCTWHVYSMSLQTSDFIKWLDASVVDSSKLNGYTGLLPTGDASNDKRYKQLFVTLWPADTNNPFNTEMVDTKFPWVKRPNIWCNKYYRANQNDVDNSTSVPVIRLPELYLTRAILMNKLGIGDLGAADLSVIQTIRGAVAGPFGEDEIEREWIRELCFEGHRLRYLMALKKDIKVGDRKDVSPITWPYSSLMSPEGGMWMIPLNETDFRQ